MPKITFIDHEGVSRDVDADNGLSLMEAATQNDIPGIEADCGGACACATCHVYIDKDWVAKLNPAEEVETDMLEMVDEIKDESRLACQIKLDDSLEGLVVTTPESQF
jgi:2Fe-2S ferredoxin